MLSLSFAWLLLCAPSYAEEPIPPTVAAHDQSEDWLTVHKRARRTTWIGLIMLPAGVATIPLGIGGFSVALGPVVQAGGALRDREALQAMGIDVSPAAGIVSLSIWGAGLVAVPTFMVVASNSCQGGSSECEGTGAAVSYGAAAIGAGVLLGSYTAGTVQMINNGKAFDRARDTYLESKSGRASTVLPLIESDRVGLVVVGTF